MRPRNPLITKYSFVKPSFKQVLSEFQENFETYLERNLPEISYLSQAMRYASLGGGKRLRPFLMAQSALMFSDEVAEEVPGLMNCASALECVHVYSLVHDDLPCMDDDDLRRGKPTVHKAYDEAIAVLAGDALLTRAFKLLSLMPVDQKVVVQSVLRLTEAAGEEGMIGGQVLDITAAQSLQDEKSITRLQKLKTGALIRFAAWSGAYLGGARDDEIRWVQDYADDLGLLFQVTDDILDEIGSAEAMGKAVGKDKNLGKATFVSILGLEGAKEKANMLADRAKRRLEPFGEKAQILSETVDYVLSREQ